METLAHGLAFPEGPTLSPDGGTLYVVNIDGDFLSRLDLETNTLTREWARLPPGGRGNGMTWGQDGALYVADVGRRGICRVSVSDGSVTAICDRTEAGDEFRGPNDLIFDTEGGLYFTDPQGSDSEPIGAVYFLPPGGQAARRVADEMRFPNGLVLTPDGQTLLVAESSLHRILAVDLASGQRSVFAVVAETGGPDGMRWGPDGFLYAAIFGEGAVVRVSPGGVVAGRYAISQGRNPTNLCFSRDGQSFYVTEAESGTLVRVTR